MAHVPARNVMAEESWDHTFVTLPEFFWNTRWSNVLSEDELMQLGDFYMDHVSDYVNRLIDAFPARSGDPSSAITFLAGTFPPET